MNVSAELIKQIPIAEVISLNGHFERNVKANDLIDATKKSKALRINLHDVSVEVMKAAVFALHNAKSITTIGICNLKPDPIKLLASTLPLFPQITCIDINELSLNEITALFESIKKMPSISKLNLSITTLKMLITRLPELDHVKALHLGVLTNEIYNLLLEKLPQDIKLEEIVFTKTELPNGLSYCMPLANKHERLTLKIVNSEGLLVNLLPPKKRNDDPIAESQKPQRLPTSPEQLHVGPQLASTADITKRLQPASSKEEPDVKRKKPAPVVIELLDDDEPLPLQKPPATTTIAVVSVDEDPAAPQTIVMKNAYTEIFNEFKALLPSMQIPGQSEDTDLATEYLQLLAEVKALKERVNLYSLEASKYELSVETLKKNLGIQSSPSSQVMRK